jgi:hypothetical protein
MKLSIRFIDNSDFVIPEIFNDKEVIELQIKDYASYNNGYYVKVYYYRIIKMMQIFRQDMAALKYDTSLESDLNNDDFICTVTYHVTETENA